MRISVCAVLCAFMVMACSTSPNGNQSSTDDRELYPATIGQAVEIGNGYLQGYTNGLKKRKQNRSRINIGIWAATAYAAGAAGLEIHADNIFIAALTAQSLRSLDPLVNPGTAENYGAAVAKTYCVSAAGSEALNGNLLSAWAGLKTFTQHNPNHLEAAATLSGYKNLRHSMMSRYLRIKSDYLAGTTADLFDPDSLPPPQSVQQETDTEAVAIIAAENSRDQILSVNGGNNGTAAGYYDPKEDIATLRTATVSISEKIQDCATIAGV